MATCKNCGEELAEDSVFCPNCGERVTRALKCASCGTELRAGARFCDQCGKAVAESEQKLTDIRGTLARTTAGVVSSKSAGAKKADEQKHKDERLFSKIQKLIAEKLEIDESSIKKESSFRGDLGVDSLDAYELVYAIEENLGIQIPDEKATEFETVNDVCEYLQRRGV